MKETRQIVFELQRGDILPLIDAQGARVACFEGSLWITQQNDQNDIVVQPGQSYDLVRNGRTVMQAMETSRIAVTAAAPSAGGASDRAQPLQMLLRRTARA
jgi:hypothetical protein